MSTSTFEVKCSLARAQNVKMRKTGQFCNISLYRHGAAYWNESQTCGKDSAMNPLPSLHRTDVVLIE